MTQVSDELSGARSKIAKLLRGLGDYCTSEPIKTAYRRYGTITHFAGVVGAFVADFLYPVAHLAPWLLAISLVTLTAFLIPNIRRKFTVDVAATLVMVAAVGTLKFGALYFFEKKSGGERGLLAQLSTRVADLQQTVGLVAADVTAIKADVNEIKGNTKRIGDDISEMRKDSKALPNELVAALEANGFISKAESGGLSKATVIALAQRLRPDEALNLEQAVEEIKRAIDVALEVVGKGARGNDESEFVNAVLAKVADMTKRAEFDGATQEVDAALAQLEEKQREQQNASRRSRAALLLAGLRQDVLARKAPSAAGRIEQLIAIEYPDDQSVRFDELHRARNTYFEIGRDTGADFTLEIAVELARREVATAPNAADRGLAYNALGTTLWTLGRRTEGTEYLELAVTAFRAALDYYAGTGVALDRSTAEGNLNTAQRGLDERNRAIKGADEGAALMQLAELRRDPDLAKQAVDRLAEALTVSNQGGDMSGVAYSLRRLIAARALRDRLSTK